MLGAIDRYASSADSACAIDRSFGQNRVSIGVKVRINGLCLICRYTCNNRLRIMISIRVRVSFTTGAVRSAILATAGLLVARLSSRILIGWHSRTDSVFIQRTTQV